MSLVKSSAAEFLGTFWLVLGGCGSAVLAAGFVPGGIGLLGVSLAFGLTVVTMAYAVGHISGGHFNPAVTVGLLAARRIPAMEAIPYIIAQVLGAICATGTLAVIAGGKTNFAKTGNWLAANGYDINSPGGYSLVACFVAEALLTFFFLFVILGATDKRASTAAAPLAIGLCLTLIHLISIPVTNTSVNPARSTGPAIYLGGTYLTQLWMFWLAPILGAVIAGIVYPLIAGSNETGPSTTEGHG